jgi:hypothetical protein
MKTWQDFIGDEIPTDVEIIQIIEDYEYFLQHGNIGQSMLRTIAEKWQENLSFHVPVTTTMRDLVNYCYKAYTLKTMKLKNSGKHKMITAADARELITLSKLENDTRLEKIGEKITEAATLGLNFISLTNKMPYNTELHVVSESNYRDPQMTAVQKLLAESLRDFGFTIVIATEKINVHNYFSPDDNSDVVEIQHYIRVSW